MSPLLITFIVLGVLAAVGSAIYTARVSAQMARLRSVPEVRLADAMHGLRVRVQGVVRALDKTINAPLTGTAAVIATSEHWECTSRGQRMRRLDRQVHATPFELDDASAVARVATDHLDVMLATTKVEPRTSGPRRAFGAGVIAANMSSQQELLEGRVEPGWRVVVVGTVRRDAAGTIELFGTAEAPLVVTDRAL